MKVYQKAVLPKGFSACGVASGIKKSGKLDLALFYSTLPAKACGMFTTTTLPAACVLVSKDHLRSAGSFRAIIVNSGNANCFTGKKGIADAYRMTHLIAAKLGIKKEAVLVGSTGIIGKRLPMGPIVRASQGLVDGLRAQGIAQAKKAIYTTDALAKECTVKFKSGKADVTVCAVAKGAGMISPNMATMLSFIFTDARISNAALKRCLKQAVDKTFNCITVDGCMSTNDTVIVMANGASRSAMIDTHTDAQFQEALETVCLSLAKSMVADGEGASKFIEINVAHAKTVAEARVAALAIANSSLFKTAMYGQNPNFGRIVAAIGASGIPVREESLKIRMSSLTGKNIRISASLGRGNKSATVYTSDLTPQYIKINAAYN